MRLAYFFLLILFACSEDDPALNSPITKCRLVKIVAQTGQTLETTYTYNDKDQIVGEQSTRDGVVDHNYVISYTADGMVEKIDMGSVINEHDYTSDGKILRERFVGKTTPIVVELREYTWGTNVVQIIYTKDGKTKPYATKEMTFSGGNITYWAYKEYVDFDTKELAHVIESTSTNFDTGLNPYFVAQQYQPGYSIISEHNPGKTQTSNTSYIKGVAQPVKTQITNNIFTYNSSNVPVAVVTTKEGTSESFTMSITYDRCQ